MLFGEGASQGAEGSGSADFDIGAGSSYTGCAVNMGDAVGFMKWEGGDEEDNAGVHGEVEFVLLECDGTA